MPRALVALCAVVFGVSPPTLHGQAQAVEDPPDPFASVGIDTGPHVELSTLLEVTIFQIDVLILEIRLPSEAAARLERAVDPGRYSEAAADSVAAVVFDSDRLWARQEILRDVSSRRITDGMLEVVDRAVEAGWVSSEYRDALASDLPELFSFLDERGVLQGDEIFLEVRGDTVRTIYRGTEGRTLLDRRTTATEARHASVPSYLAPGTRFRRGLVESWLEEPVR